MPPESHVGGASFMFLPLVVILSRTGFALGLKETVTVSVSASCMCLTETFWDLPLLLHTPC